MKREFLNSSGGILVYLLIMYMTVKIKKAGLKAERIYVHDLVWI